MNKKLSVRKNGGIAMFPVTHIYFYSMLFPRSTAGAIGAIYPDTTLLTGLKWPETHRFATELFDRISPQERAEFGDFLRGFMTHAVDSYGLDYYGDEKYDSHERGYAYYKAEPIITDVVKACRIPESMGLWKAHNFVEMGIECLVARKNPWLKDWIQETREDAAEIRRISNFLARHYPVSEETFVTGITDFFRFLISSGDTQELGKSYKCVLDIRHGITEPDPCEIASVIEKACDIVKDEYEAFLIECRDKFRARWENVLFTENMPVDSTTE